VTFAALRQRPRHTAIYIKGTVLERQAAEEFPFLLCDEDGEWGCRPDSEILNDQVCCSEGLLNKDIGEFMKDEATIAFKKAAKTVAKKVGNKVRAWVLKKSQGQHVLDAIDFLRRQKSKWDAYKLAAENKAFPCGVLRWEWVVIRPLFGEKRKDACDDKTISVWGSKFLSNAKLICKGVGEMKRKVSVSKTGKTAVKKGFAGVKKFAKKLFGKRKDKKENDEV